MIAIARQNGYFLCAFVGYVYRLSRYVNDLYAMSSQSVMYEIGNQNGKKVMDENADGSGHEAFRRAAKEVNMNGIQSENEDDRECGQGV